MSRLWSLILLASGCVIHTDDLKIDDLDGDEDVSLWVEPQDVERGAVAVLTVTDDYGQADFRDAWGVRSLGDYEIVEWSPRERELTLVVQLLSDAQGEQPVAIDFDNGTAYASFQAY